MAAGSGKFARTIAAAVPIATPPDPSFGPHLSDLRPCKRLVMGAVQGTPKMAKKTPKTGLRAPSGAAPKKRGSAATKGPARSPNDSAERIARALEAIAAHLSAAAPSPAASDPFASADAFVWHPDGRLAPVPHVSRVDIGLLKGIERMRDILIENTERFADGLPANNALLWGCLLYTSDAADDLLCVDLGGRRIIKKKQNLMK